MITLTGGAWIYTSLDYAPVTASFDVVPSADPSSLGLGSGTVTTGGIDLPLLSWWIPHCA